MNGPNFLESDEWPFDSSLETPENKSGYSDMADADPSENSQQDSCFAFFCYCSALPLFYRAIAVKFQFLSETLALLQFEPMK